MVLRIRLYYLRNSDLYTSRSLIGITVAYKIDRVISNRGKRIVALAIAVNILLSGTTYLFVGLPRIIVIIIVSSSRNKPIKYRSRLSKRASVLRLIILITLINRIEVLPIIARMRLVRSRLILRLSSNSLSYSNITSTRKRSP